MDGFKILRPGETEPVFEVRGVQKTIRHPLRLIDYIRAWWKGQDAVGRVEVIEEPQIFMRGDLLADGSIHALRNGD